MGCHWAQLGLHGQVGEMGGVGGLFALKQCVSPQPTDICVHMYGQCCLSDVAVWPQFVT